MTKLLVAIIGLFVIGCKTSHFRYVKTNVERKKGGVVEVFEINGKVDSFGQSGYTIKRFRCQNKEKAKVTFLFWEAQSKFRIERGDSIVIQSYFVYVQYFVH